MFVIILFFLLWFVSNELVDYSRRNKVMVDIVYFEVYFVVLGGGMFGLGYCYLLRICCEL